MEPVLWSPLSGVVSGLEVSGWLDINNKLKLCINPTLHLDPVPTTLRCWLLWVSEEGRDRIKSPRGSIALLSASEPQWLMPLWSDILFFSSQTLAGIPWAFLWTLPAPQLVHIELLCLLWPSYPNNLAWDLEVKYRSLTKTQIKNAGKIKYCRKFPGELGFTFVYATT